MITFHPARIALAALLAMGATVTAFGVSSPGDPNQAGARSATVVEPLVVPAAPVDTARRFTRSILVTEGDTIGSILRSSGVSDEEFAAFARESPDTEALRSLIPGRVIHLDTDAASQVLELRYSLGIDESGVRSGESRRLDVVRTPTGLEAGISHVPLARITQMALASIETSLFAATNDAGIPYSIANQIVDVFSNEIRFERDLRPGSLLKVSYELLHMPDSLDAPEPGRLLAVELTARGERFTAVWIPFDNGGGGQYYDFEGRSAESTFLRYPIEFARISSGFSKARLHPLSGRRVPHLGTDFAAVPGTPIRATGTGTVESMTDQRGYGLTVVIRHGDRYSTLYAHMQGFRKGLHAGAAVKQGDVIGYVGSSGWATGPHVHYEFRVDGKPKNSLKIALPQASPLTADKREYHAMRVNELKVQFAQLEQGRLVANFR